MIINVNQHYFHIIENHKDAFNQEMFEGRYSEILDRYPYIVGDIGFEQLRLKGFFDDKKKGADISKRFSSIQDYLLEYCNFGCAYFVLKRLSESEIVKLVNPETIETQETNGLIENNTNHKLIHDEETHSEDIASNNINDIDYDNKSDVSSKTLKDFL